MTSTEKRKINENTEHPISERTFGVGSEYNEYRSTETKTAV